MAGEFEELMQLAADLESAPKALPKHLATALGRTSQLVKKDAQDSVKSRKLLGHAAGAIDYELKGSSGAVSEMSSEIGYNKDKPAGPLGSLIEFGAPNAKAHMLVKGKGGKFINVPVPGAPSRPLAPSHDLGNSLLKNEDDFVRGVGNAVADAMAGEGL